MKENESITINLNFIFNTASTTNIKETVVEQVLNIDYNQLVQLAEQKQEGENHG